MPLRAQPIISTHPDIKGWLIPCLLMCTTTFGLLSTDLFVPSLPHLEDAFGTSRNRVQLTLSLNLAAFAFAQLFWGPIVDRVSRRRAIVLGMWLFAFSNLACATAWSINALIVSRIFQGLSSSAAAVIVLVIIREVYEGHHAIRVMSVLGAVTSLSPLFGAIIGGYIHVNWGWRVNFIAVSLMSAMLAFVLSKALPETAQNSSNLVRTENTFYVYLKLLKNYQFIRLALISSFLMAGLLAYITGAPFVFQQIFEIPVDRYGYYHSILVLTYMAGSFSAPYVSNFLSPKALIRSGTALAACTNLGLLLLVLLGRSSITTTILCLAPFCFGMGLVYAVAPLEALAKFSEYRGAATALFGTLKISGAASGALTMSLIGQSSANSLILIVGFFALCALLISEMPSRSGD